MVKNSTKATKTKSPSVRNARNSKSAFDLKNTKPSRRKSSIKDFRPDVRKLILGIVIINVIIVAAAVIAYFKFVPKYHVPAVIDDIAAKYYENVFYENLITSDKYSGDPDVALNRYTDHGFTPITLRQLILQTKSDDSTKSYLEKYCDTDTTSVVFYPDSPYTRSSYHFKVDSSCEVE